MFLIILAFGEVAWPLCGPAGSIRFRCIALSRQADLLPESSRANQEDWMKIGWRLDEDWMKIGWMPLDVWTVWRVWTAVGNRNLHSAQHIQHIVTLCLCCIDQVGIATSQTRHFQGVRAVINAGLAADKSMFPWHDGHVIWQHSSLAQRIWYSWIFLILSWYWGYWGCWFKFVDSNLAHPDIRFNSRPRSCDVLGGDGRDEDLPPGVAQFQWPQLAIQIEAQILVHESYDNKYDNGMKPMAWISWIVRNFTDKLVHYNHYKIWIAPTAFKDSRVPRFRTVEFDGAMEILHIIIYNI